jgi:membrane protease YdiL (CAAX protease family)
VTILIAYKLSYFLLGTNIRNRELQDTACVAGEFSEIFTGFLYGVILFAIVSLLSLTTLFGPIISNESLFSDLLALYKSNGILVTIGGNLILLTVSSSTEEFLFRGILFGGFAKSFGAIISGILSTLFFILIHCPINGIGEIILYIAISIVALNLRIKHKAIGPAISFHLTYNYCILAIAISKIVKI